MTKEDYLKPRYRCIAFYPQFPYNKDEDEHKFIEGDILVQCNVNGALTYNRTGRLGYMSVGVPCCSHPEKYPKIFQLLQWWEERDAKSMPDYVKLNPENTIGGGRVFKVLYKHVCDDGIELVIDDEKQTNMECKYLIPCDESDYISYIKSLKP